ncbi:MAG: hypothetical protein WDA00_04145 [Eubacteriales bacterium]
MYRIDQTDTHLVIKEWSWGPASGADIYYRNEQGKERLLGKTDGGANGYCPFADNQYEIINHGDKTFTVRWSARQGASPEDWKEQNFTIPD